MGCWWFSETGGTVDACTQDGEWSLVFHGMVLFRQITTFEGLVEGHTGSGKEEKSELAMLMHPSIRVEFWSMGHSSYLHALDY